MLAWMVEAKNIDPHVPVWQKTERKDGNEYRCPRGNALRSEWRPSKNPRTHITKSDTVIYRSGKSNRAGCAVKDL